MSAQRSLNNTTSALNTVFQRLSSGSRINSAKDDPAGLMISNRLTAQINGYKQGARNLNDGIAVAQTMEHALDESKNMLQRIRTLAIQAASDTYDNESRQAIDIEVQELCHEITRISKQTTFAGAKLLDGNNGLFAGDGSLDIQCSGNVGDKISISSFEKGFSMEGLGQENSVLSTSSFMKGSGDELSFSLTSSQNAESVISVVDKYISSMSLYQAKLGAVQNRMESAIRNNGSMAENLADARSRIMDTDYAEEASNLAELMVRQHIIASLFSKIAQSKNVILSLLGA